MIHMPQRLEPTGLAALRHLTVNVKHSSHDTATLPPLDRLRSLDIYFTGRITMPSSGTAARLVDFSRFRELVSLYIEGDAWSGVADRFTGSSDSLLVCILRGPLVITAAFNQFFDRISTTLRYLYLYGTHLVGRVDTRFLHLQHLSLHKVISGNRVFPFPHCQALRSLAIESEDVYAPSRLEDLNGLLQVALLHTASTLQFLILRSGFFWILSPISVHAIQRAIHLRALLLDGAVVLDGRDWLLILASMNLELIVRIDSWLHATVSISHRTAKLQDTDGELFPQNDIKALVQQKLPGMTADRDKFRQARPGTALSAGRACTCGLLNRQMFSRSTSMESVCFEVYSWLISDPRSRRCTHENIMERASDVILSFEAAKTSIIPLPGPEPSICVMWPSRAPGSPQNSILVSET